MPRVTVVIPTYNYGRFVGQAIESVLAQTFRDFELLVVDDGSTDDTGEVVARFRDPRLGYLRQTNSGLAASRNTGIRNTGGELIAFLDADDGWFPAKLERQVALLDAHPAVGLVCGGYVVRDEATGREIVRRPAPLRGRVLDRVAVENVVSGSASVAIVRRLVLDRVGVFDEKLQAAEDWDLWLRIARVAEFDYVDEPVAWYRRHATSMSRQLPRMETALNAVIDRFYSDESLPVEIRRLKRHAQAAANLALARIALPAGRRAALPYLLRAIRHRLLWPDPYILLMTGPPPP